MMTFCMGGVIVVSNHANRGSRNRFRKRLFLEQLEPRLVLTGLTPHSFAFDLIDLYDMRRAQEFQEVDGDGIGIAIIDTGVDTSHRMFTDRVVANVDLVYQTEGNYFTSGHGTHVAGIAAASDPDIGIANKADIISLQVFSMISSCEFSSVFLLSLMSLCLGRRRRRA